MPGALSAGTGGGILRASATIDGDDGIAGNQDDGIRHYHADSGLPAGEIVVPGHWIRVLVSIGLDVVVSLTGMLARLQFPVDARVGQLTVGLPAHSRGLGIGQRVPEVRLEGTHIVRD